MPQAARRPCTWPGCKALASTGGRCEAHPGKAWAQRSKPVKRITGRRLQALREALFKADPLCAECKRQGRVTLAVKRDHIKPLAEDGEDVETNVQGLCDPCHDAKSERERARGRWPTAYQGGG